MPVEEGSLGEEGERKALRAADSEMNASRRVLLKRLAAV